MSNKVLLYKRTLYYLICLLPFFYNIFMNKIEFVYKINMVFKIFLTCYLLFLYFFKNRRRKGWIDISLFFTFIILFISTVVNSGSITKYFGYFISCYSLYLLMYTSDTKRKMDAFLQALYIIFNIYVLLELLSLIAWPQGMFDSFGISRLSFLGLDNNATPFIIAAFGFINFYNANKIFNISNMVLNVILIIELVILKSGTAIIGILVYFLIISLKKPNFRRITKYSMIVSIALFSVFYIGNNISVLRYFVENVLGKDMSLTGRVPIWYAYTLDIKDHFFLGHGIREVNQALVYVANTWDYRQAHNEYLQHIADGGIFYLMGFLWTIFIVIKNTCFNSQNKHLFASFISFIVIFATETYSQNTMFFLVLFLLYFTKDKRGDFHGFNKCKKELFV